MKKDIEIFASVGYSQPVIFSRPFLYLARIYPSDGLPMTSMTLGLKSIHRAVSRTCLATRAPTNKC